MTIALAALAAGLTTADVTARSKKAAPVVEAPPPPPPPPLPPVSLGQRLIDDAAAYQDYMTHAALISPAFTDANGVQQSLRAGAAYEPGQFVRGEMVYAAIAALQNQRFVAAVRAAASTPDERYAIVRGIFAAPSYAFGFNGAADAAGLAKDALSNDGMRLFNAGKAVTLAAYSIQHQPWSLQDVASRDARLDTVKTLSRSPRPPAGDEAAALQRAATGEQALALAPDSASPPYSPVIVRALALAALAAIGEAGDDKVSNISWLTDDYFTDHCLAHAKNELNVCLSVAKPNYEDVFCLGEHAMNDTGACVVKGAGSTVPLEISTTPLVIPPYHHGPTARHARRRHRA